MNRYIVRLTYAQVIALVDIALGYRETDSPRWDGRTLSALADRRQLVALPSVRDTKKQTREKRLQRLARARLTKKGEAYLNLARYEYETAADFLRDHAA